MHIPGIDLDKLNVKVESTQLHISGAREEKKEERKEGQKITVTRK